MDGAQKDKRLPLSVQPLSSILRAIVYLFVQAKAANTLFKIQASNGGCGSLRGCLPFI
jgi:hypothetical protein